MSQEIAEFIHVPPEPESLARDINQITSDISNQKDLLFRDLNQTHRKSEFELDEGENNTSNTPATLHKRIAVELPIINTETQIISEGEKLREMENMPLVIPPIKDKNLKKYCQEHGIAKALSIAYSHAKMCFPNAKDIDIYLVEPYDGEQDSERVVFAITTSGAPEEILKLDRKFNKILRIYLPNDQYICTTYRFI